MISGGKLKKFIPILAAAAGGSHQRSLESVDFRSCEFVGDADVNALCSLHSRVRQNLHLNVHVFSSCRCGVLKMVMLYRIPCYVQTVSLYSFQNKDARRVV